MNRCHGLLLPLLVGLSLALSAGLVMAGSAGSGAVDTTFGADGDGILELVPPWTSGDPRLVAPVLVEVDASGRMVVCASGRSGTAPADWRLRRYAADGSLDTSFGDGGERAYFDDVAPGAFPSAFTLDATGIWMAGKAWRQTVSGRGKRQTVVDEEVLQVARVLASGANAGDLDPSFNGGAPLVLGSLPVSDGFYTIAAVVTRSDGSALVVGSGSVTAASSGGSKKKGGGGGQSSWGLVVAAVNTDGSLDTTYGDGGWARHDLDPTTNDDAALKAAQVQSTGEVVILTANAGIVRFDAAGDFDATFGTDGVVDGHAASLRALAVDADDSVYAAGLDASFQPHVYRYDADGAADTAFGSGGLVTLTGLFGLAQHGLAVEEVSVTQRRLVVATGIDDAATGGIVAARLLLDGFTAPAGTLDTSFGPDADGVSEPLRKIIDTTSGDTERLWNAWDVAVHANGDITIADAVTVYTDSQGAQATIEACLGRICGN